MKRRTFIRGLAGAVPMGSLMYYLNPEEEFSMGHTFNPKLPYVKVPSGWKGTPIRNDGTYQNLVHPFSSSMYSVLKWKLSQNPQANLKRTDKRTLEIEQITGSVQRTKDQLIWLGHASYLITLGGLTMLTDPIWLDNWVLKRHSPLPIDPEKIREVDYILLSHDHRDHCDEATLKLLAKTSPNATILTGLSMQSLVQPWMPKNKIQEAGWFQSYDLKESIQITFVPTRHWSRRGLMDINKRLWGGFYIESAERSLYFMGDSGYGSHFELISDTLGAPEVAMMGIGAYKPEWFMHPAHTSPMEAAQAFRDMKAQTFIPMHFGTFDLSDEPLLEPIDWLKANPDQVNHSLIEPILGRNLLV